MNSTIVSIRSHGECHYKNSGKNSEKCEENIFGHKRDLKNMSIIYRKYLRIQSQEKTLSHFMTEYEAISDLNHTQTS